MTKAELIEKLAEAETNARAWKDGYDSEKYKVHEMEKERNNAIEEKGKVIMREIDARGEVDHLNEILDSVNDKCEFYIELKGIEVTAAKELTDHDRVLRNIARETEKHMRDRRRGLNAN